MRQLSHFPNTDGNIQSNPDVVPTRKIQDEMLLLSSAYIVLTSLNSVKLLGSRVARSKVNQVAKFKFGRVTAVVTYMASLYTTQSLRISSSIEVLGHSVMELLLLHSQAPSSSIGKSLSPLNQLMN